MAIPPSDNPTTPPVPAAEHVRTCPHCSGKFRLQGQFASVSVQCPQCGQTVAPPEAQPHPPYRRARRIDPAAGWVASLALHVLLLVMFMGVTWLTGAETGRGPGERRVGIVPGEQEKAIGPGQADPIQDISALADVTIPNLEPSQEIQPIADVGSDAGARSKLDQIISIDLGSSAGGGAGMQADWSSFAGAGGGDAGGGGASFFGLRARGGKFVFVVDRSGSMRGAPLAAAKSELIRSVSALDRGMKFYIIFFDSSHHPMPARGLVAATEQNKRTHFAWVGGMTGSGGTNPTSATLLALSLKPDAIWLLSDGIFSARAAEQIARANPGRKVQIHTIAFLSRSGEALLGRIAEDNRGQYRFVPAASVGLRRP